MSGKFITFEGGEGVGKSTQVKLLAEKLRELGYKVFVTREPGGAELGEKIRSLLKASTQVDPICELLLIFAARRDHFVKLIVPHLENNEIVICDRFYDSSLVYQGILKNVQVERIMELKQMTLGYFEPDLTIILDMDVEKSRKRLAERKLIADEYDSMNAEKHELVRQGFKKISEIFSFRSVLINAGGSERNVFSKVFNEVEKRILNEALKV
ncbi:MAG: dTMP kinase [Alphaproteobacteria bacterium]|nr:dTMP kinase [Alphaproteobacteria bacterium]